MADIELVIKIPDKYISIDTNVKEWIDKAGNDCKVRPLPKGHGRLIDADRLINKYAYDLDNNFIVDLKDITDAPTIIEADKENEE